MLNLIPGRSLGLNDSLYTTDLKYVSRLEVWEDYIVGSYLSLVCALAVLLNSIVIYICLRNWNVLVASDYFILNLACSDVILPMCGFPLAISSSYRHFWIFDDFGCTLYGFLGFFFGLVSITTLTMMGATRYISICHPGKDVGDYQTTVKIIVCSYLYALLWSLIPLTGWGSYTAEAYGTSCTLQWDKNRSFITLMSLFCIVTPSFVIIAAYGLILLKCRKSAGKLSSWGARKSKAMSRKEGYLVKMTFAMCWGFLICWMPYAVVSTWTAYGDPTVLPTRITVMAVLLAKTSTVVNPVVYVMMSRKFRPMLSEVFKSLYGNNDSSIEVEPHTPQSPSERDYKHFSRHNQISIEDSSSSELQTIRIKRDSSSSSKESYV